MISQIKICCNTKRQFFIWVLNIKIYVVHGLMFCPLPYEFLPAQYTLHFLNQFDSRTRTHSNVTLIHIVLRLIRELDIYLAQGYPKQIWWFNTITFKWTTEEKLYCNGVLSTSSHRTNTSKYIFTNEHCQFFCTVEDSMSHLEVPLHGEYENII